MNVYKSPVSEDPSTSNMVNELKRCSKLNDSTLTIEFWSKMSPSVIWKILGLFLNPLTADRKYSLLNTENLKQHFQMQ